jgi:hypothetical protein
MGLLLVYLLRWSDGGVKKIKESMTRFLREPDMLKADTVSSRGKNPKKRSLGLACQPTEDMFDVIWPNDEILDLDRRKDTQVCFFINKTMLNQVTLVRASGHANPQILVTETNPQPAVMAPPIIRAVA